ncbi:MAG: TIR domain-containing protein [Candidatus Acidiferrum sp.]
MFLDGTRPIHFEPLRKVIAARFDKLLKRARKFFITKNSWLNRSPGRYYTLRRFSSFKNVAGSITTPAQPSNTGMPVSFWKDHGIFCRAPDSEKASFDYDVALSFAGENRDAAEKIAYALISLGVRVFYDKFERDVLLGKNLFDYLTEVYSSRSKFCLILISESYVLKEWTNLERQSAQARSLSSANEYILPVRIDDTAVPGVLATVACEDLRFSSAEEIAKVVLKKVRASGVKQHPLRDASDRSTVLFELRSDESPSDLLSAHEITTQVMRIAKDTGISLVGWEHSPLRLELHAQQSAFEALQTAYVEGALDRNTKVSWVTLRLLDTKCCRTPEQTPIRVLPGLEVPEEADCVVCHLDTIHGYEVEALEAEQFVKPNVSDISSCRIYTTMKENSLYVHSNFVKCEAKFPTKIAIDARVSLFLLLYNIVSWGEIDNEGFRELMLAHQTKVRYFINRDKIQKGDAHFFSGACNIEFVRPNIYSTLAKALLKYGREKK